MSMLEKVNTAIGIKANIKSAIEAKKGSAVTGAFTTYPAEIANLPTGLDPSDANATDGEVLVGKTYYARNSTKHTGSMPIAIKTISTNSISCSRGYLANGFIADRAPVGNANATEADVRLGKTFFAGSIDIKTGTAQIGMPSIPSSFTTLELNESYTASGDGWVKYKVCHYWGGGQSSYLTIGTRVYQILCDGEDMDSGTAVIEGIAPVFSGETFELTASGGGTIINNSYVKVAYV